ncbi:hypothetical protein G9A89_020481 [Geosiphon pyriformis]|nr:hypothetical protein G9A89_020481 [Geosiphon pyriformis]
MNQAIKGLQAEFQKACAELSFIEAKVESEFTRKYEIERHAPLNPHKALGRLKKLKQNLSNLRVESDRIMAAKQEFIRETDDQLAANHEILTRLQKQAGIQSDTQILNTLENYEIISKSWREDIIDYQGGRYKPMGLEELLPAHETSFIAISAAAESDMSLKKNDLSSSLDDTGLSLGVQDLDFCLLNSRPDYDDLQIKDIQNTDKENQGSDSIDIKVERRLSRSFVPVTREEFESVSELVRTKKLTLESVNKVYRVLWEHFRKHRKSLPLTTQQMTQMGLKVTGATGEANLKVLRSLKIIKLEKSVVTII